MKYWKVLVILAMAAALVAAAPQKKEQPAAPAAASAPQPWIIDTDVAIDDWPAMFFMLNHPQVKVVGITVSGCGEAHPELGVQNAMNLCQLTGQAQVPVAVAHSEPLDGYHVFPTPWRAMANTLSGIPVPPHKGAKTPLDALALLTKLLKESPGKVNILALGPLTNLSEFFDKEPALMAKVGKLVIMGGAVRVKGNIIVPTFTDHLKNQVAEWNIFVDPVAAKRVFRSRVPKVLVPLDATNQVQITPEFVEAFTKRANSPEAKFMAQVFAKEVEFIKSGEFYFWDPLAAAVGVEENLGTFENLKLDVVVKYTREPILQPEALFYSRKLKNGRLRRNFDYHETGRTVETPNGSPVKVCMKADGEKFKERYIRLINKEEKSAATAN
jgi:pyrimidine-specific ribonucleoside hydrolase